MKEHTLIEHIRHGDVNALDTLIRQYYPQIYSYVYARVKYRDIAADITQEVFIRFTQHIDSYTFQGKTKQYLLRWQFLVNIVWFFLERCRSQYVV